MPPVCMTDVVRGLRASVVRAVLCNVHSGIETASQSGSPQLQLPSVLDGKSRTGQRREKSDAVEVVGVGSMGPKYRSSKEDEMTLKFNRHEIHEPS